MSDTIASFNKEQKDAIQIQRNKDLVKNGQLLPNVIITGKLAPYATSQQYLAKANSLKLKSKGDVKKLQRKLGFKGKAVDGIYGEATDKAFEAAHQSYKDKLALQKAKKQINVNEAVSRTLQNNPEATNSGSAIYVEFPNYMINTEFPTTESAVRLPLGHGMVIAVDALGKTRGSEYGRYGNQNGHKGLARRVIVPDFKMSNPGNPSQEELNSYAQALDQKYGHSGGRTKVSYINNINASEMQKLMESAEKGNGFYTNTDYCLLGHNCKTYGQDLIKAAANNKSYSYNKTGEYSKK